MQIADFLPAIFGSVMAVMGWFTRILWEAQKELRDDLSRLREELPRQFVLRDDYRADVLEIKSMLREVREALSDKADR